LDVGVGVVEREAAKTTGRTLTTSTLRGLAGKREVWFGIEAIAAFEDPDHPPSIHTLTDTGDIRRLDPDAGVVQVRLVELSPGEGVVHTREWRWKVVAGAPRLPSSIVSLSEELVDVEADVIDVVAWSREGDG
jgi:hypothetical protein